MPEPLRVLLIDDNPDDRALVLRELKHEYPRLAVHHVTDAGSFRVALELDEYDIVITDFQLRWSDGLAVLHAVHDRRPEIPTVMFTGTGSEEIAVEAMKNGLDEYVVKSPKHLKRLRAAVRRAIERAEHRRALALAEIKLQELFDGLPAGVYRTSPEGILLYANPAMKRLLGHPAEGDVVGMDVSEAYVDPTARLQWKALAERDDVVREFETRLRRDDGSVIWIRDQGRAVRGSDGAVLYYEGVIEDVTERKRAEEELRHSEARLAAVLHSTLDAHVTMAAGGAITGWNAPAERLFGWTAAEVLGRPVVDTIIPERYREAHRRGLAHFLATGEGRVLGRRVELSALHRDGHEFPVELTVSPIRLGDSWLFSAFVRDLTQQRELEARILQAQKMEAVGRLAGGVAHDFNNILTVILSETELILMDMPPEDRHREPIAEIRKAAERASMLTRQLLTFSRKQLVEPAVLSLNDVVRDMEKMLHRLVGEDVQLRLRLARRLGAVRADRHQIEQVLANLVINARDAMPQGGAITIETSEMTLDEQYVRAHAGAQPGRHVVLSVNDTGTGMTDEVKAHLFEPFFTTKEKGKGTGLGLATCYGIVKQAGGHIGVYSEAGMGTAMRVYLPRVDARARGRSSAQAEIPRGTETVLVVEDEPSVRQVAARVLEAQGYRVILAAGGAAALELLESTEPIHLLLTDVVMPEMGGGVLAERARHLRPGLKVLFASGYSDDVVLQRKLVEAHAALLQKPFTIEALAQKVREVLDG